jgi:tRNA-specific 2-thiouridylase
MKIAVAMSGGVDSSVAAALLKKEGYDVTGLTMLLHPPAAEKYNGGSPLPDAAADARKVAEKIGIPYGVVDLRGDFSSAVIADFCREYSLGRTPNPCVLCNREIKFGRLWEKAKELGADYLATGHYARVEKDAAGGKFLLKKGKDKLKDQSYFLCRLTQEQLARTLFPLGGMTKTEVKRIAKEMGLPSAARRESQEICFIPGDNYAGFLKQYLSADIRPGPILDSDGKVLGEHRGIPFYTVGQRKGLGVAAKNSLYVTAIDAEKNAIIVGAKAETLADGLSADNLNWISGARPELPAEMKVAIRYRHPGAGAIVTRRDKNSVYVKFAEPQMAITPGQTAVFYEGDTVIGGGTIISQGR